MTVKKCDCNFSVEIKVPNFEIKFSGHFQKFTKIRELKKIKNTKIWILYLYTVCS